MRKLLIFFLLTLTMFAKGYISLEVYKETNGSYIYSLPKVSWENTYGYFYKGTEVELLFSAPRGDITSLNHYALKHSTAFGFSEYDWTITFSIDSIYYIKDNDFNMDEKLVLGNTLVIKYNF
jgi:hypothetical protein